MAKGKKKPLGLEQFQNRRFFESWAEDVDAKLVTSSEASIRKLVEALAKLGTKLTESAARKAVDQCVRRFNRLDEDGWICTIEREDIGEVIWEIVEACGFTQDEEWLNERQW